MRLNCFNKTVLVAEVMEQQGVKGLNPRFGAGRSVSDTVFSYLELGGAGTGLLIDKVNLGDLFKGIPQDITGLTFGIPEEVDLQPLHALIDTSKEECIVTGDKPPEVLGDDLSILFYNWLRLVGLSDLSRFEVELGVSEGYLHVTARRDAVYYCGTVIIKYQ